MTQLELCNLALDKLGEPPITALNAAMPAAQACTRLYQPTLDALVRKYRWNFARKSARLEPTWIEMDAIMRTGDPGTEALVVKSSHGLVTGNHLQVKDTVEADGYWEVRRLDSGEFNLIGSSVTDAVEQGSYSIAPDFTWAYSIALPDDCLSLRTVEGYEVGRPHQFFVLEGRNIFCNLEEVEVTYTQKQTGGTDEDKFDTIFNDLFACSLAAELAMPVTGAMSRRGDMMSLYGEVLQTALMSNVFERRDNLIDRTAGPTSAIARQYA